MALLHRVLLFIVGEFLDFHWFHEWVLGLPLGQVLFDVLLVYSALRQHLDPLWTGLDLLHRRDAEGLDPGHEALPGLHRDWVQTGLYSSCFLLRIRLVDFVELDGG